MGGISNAQTWLVIGFLGQAVFTGRFLVQWVASERKRDSVVPVAFWWLSLIGGMTLFSYAVYRSDPVFMVGQSLGLVIYVRNLMLIDKVKRRPHNRARYTNQQAASAIPRPHLSARMVPSEQTPSE